MGKIKVIHIITKLELGGAQQNTIFTVNNLNKEKYEVYLAFGKGGILTNEVIEKLKERAIIIPHLIREINPIYDLRALIEIYRIIKKIKPKIVHTHSSKAGILGRIASYLAGVPVIIHSIHGFGFNKYQNKFLYFLLKTLEKIVAKFTTHFIAVSKANMQQGVKEKLFPSDKVSLIRSGIDLNEFRSAKESTIKKEFNIKENFFIVSMIACFKPQKAPLDFVYIAEKIIKLDNNFKFILVGDGNLRPKIEYEIAKRKLEEHIILTGWRRDIKNIICGSHIIVLTSLWEGLPRTIIEAMACNKPIVATNVDGVKDVIIDGENGFLAQPHNIDEFVEKILMLKKNKLLYDKFVNAPKKLDDFDINLMVKQQEDLYIRMLSK